MFGSFFAGMAMYSSGYETWQPWYAKMVQIVAHQPQGKGGEVADQAGNKVYSTAGAWRRSYCRRPSRLSFDFRAVSAMDNLPLKNICHEFRSRMARLMVQLAAFRVTVGCGWCCLGTAIAIDWWIRFTEHSGGLSFLFVLVAMIAAAEVMLHRSRCEKEVDRSGGADLSRFSG